MNERRRYSRRSILRAATVLPASAALTSIAYEAFMGKEVDLSGYQATTIAHNAALTPETLYRALRSSVDYVEVDITLVDGKPVVAHSPKEYRELSFFDRKHQDVERILDQIAKAQKTPMFDLKNEIRNIADIPKLTGLLNESPGSMVSSNTHGLLNSIRANGYNGKLLYSIGNKGAFDNFSPLDLGENAGVSVQWELLNEAKVANLKSYGLTVVAWNPTTPGNIKKTLEYGVNAITSDNTELLGTIGNPNIMIADQEHQLPPAG